MVKRVLHKLSGRKWKAAWPGTRCQDNPQFVACFDEQISPTRLQWTWAEVAAARRSLKANQSVIGTDPSRVRPGGPFRRFKQFLRDPSEAPQSDQIVPLFEKQIGQRLTILGGSAIHIAGGFLTGLESLDPTLHDRLIALDQEPREKGYYHFGFGLWQKPA